MTRARLYVDGHYVGEATLVAPPAPSRRRWPPALGGTLDVVILDDHQPAGARDVLHVHGRLERLAR